MATGVTPGAYKRNVYLFWDNRVEVRDSELADRGWVTKQLRDERYDRINADDALLKEIENETLRAVEAEATKEDLSNKVASDVSYISDNTHYATTAAVDQRIADISPKQIEWATYGVTTCEQLKEWHNAGKLVLCKNNYGNIFMLTYKQADNVFRFTFIKTYDGTSRDPKLAYKTMSCVADVWSMQATEQGVETFDNKLTSTSPWVSDDYKYPTTKAVENYVAEHAPEPLDLDVEAFDGDVRVFRADASSSSYAYGGQVGKTYPFVNDFIRRDGFPATVDSYITLRNHTSGTKRMLNVAAIKDSCYYVRRPAFSINGLASKYYSSTNNTGKKMLQAMITDGYHLLINIPNSTSLNIASDMSGQWFKADLDSVDSAIGYYDAPKLLAGASGTSDLYECAWYVKDQPHGWFQLNIHEDGTPGALGHGYKVFPCVALKKFSTSQANATTALKFECAYILRDVSTGGNWDGYIIDGAFSMHSSTSIGDGAVYGAVISKRYGVDRFEANNSWIALTCSSSMSFQSSSTIASAPWGIKIVDDVNFRADDTHCIAQGIAKCDRATPTPSQPGDATMYWRGGAAWRKWKQRQSDSHNQKYPWGDILVRAKPTDSQGQQDNKAWHQAGAMPPNTTTKMINSHPDGWWQSHDIVETCWSPDPGWIAVDGDYSFAGAQGNSSNSGSFFNSPMWYNMAWIQSTNFPQYRRDPASDEKFVAAYSLAFRDLSSVNAFHHTTSTARVVVYTDKDLFTNETTTVKDKWKFIVDGIRYQLYPALMASNNCFKKCLLVIHEGSEWGIGDKDPDYPWHNFVFDGGYIATDNGNLGLIQCGIYADTTTQPGPVWCLWSDQSGTSNTVRNFWAYQDKFCYMDINKGCIVGSKKDSTDKYITSPYLGSWVTMYTEAPIPVAGKPISEITATSFPQLFDYNALDIVEDAKDAITYKRYYSTANGIDMVGKTATSYYIDPDTKELVFGTWNWDKSSYTDKATKTEERIALGGDCENTIVVEYGESGVTSNSLWDEQVNNNKVIFVRDGIYMYKMYYASVAVCRFSLVAIDPSSRDTTFKQVVLTGSNWIKYDVEQKLRSTDTWASNDNKYPTTAAIDARIVAVLQQYGLIP